MTGSLPTKYLDNRLSFKKPVASFCYFFLREKRLYSSRFSIQIPALCCYPALVGCQAHLLTPFPSQPAGFQPEVRYVSGAALLGNREPNHVVRGCMLRKPSNRLQPVYPCRQPLCANRACRRPLVIYKLKRVSCTLDKDSNKAIDTFRLISGPTSHDEMTPHKNLTLTQIFYIRIIVFVFHL